MLPAAGIFDHPPAQNAGRAVEVEEIAGARTSPMLQDKMAVEQHGFDFGEEAVIPVQVAPARLHDAHGRIREMMNGARKEIRRGHEIGIEDRHEFTGGGLQPFLQRPGFEPFAIIAVMIFEGKPQRAIALDKRLGEGRGIVGRIVQHLDLEQVARVLNVTYFVDQPFDDIAFVEDRQLNGDPRQLRELFGRLAGGFLAMLEISANDLVAMHAVNREHGQNRKIRDQNRPIEPAKLMNAAEGVVEQTAHHAGSG